jgi:hypothetical protein
MTAITQRLRRIDTNLLQLLLLTILIFAGTRTGSCAPMSSNPSPSSRRNLACWPSR